MGHKRRMAWMDLKTPEAYVFEEDSSYSVGKGKKQFENPVQRPLFGKKRETGCWTKAVALEGESSAVMRGVPGLGCLMFPGMGMSVEATTAL